MKKTIISLSVAALFGSGMVNAGVSAYVAPISASPYYNSGTGKISSINNNFTMVSAANGLTGGDNTTTFTWDGTYNTSVVTDGSSNATLSSPTAFSGKKWTAHHVNIYKPGSYTFYTGCASGGVASLTYNPSCVAGSTYTMNVGAGQVGAHMLFNWSTSIDIDVIVLWDMNKSWAQTGSPPPTASAFNPGLGNTTATVWNAVSIDADADADTWNGTKMIDGPFVGQSANFSVNGILPFDEVPPTLSSTSPANGTSLDATSTVYAVTFSEEMLASTVIAGGLTFGGCATSNGAPTTVDGITWSFPVTLAAWTGVPVACTVQFNAGPTDLAGNAVVLSASQTFNTSGPDIISPTIQSSSPIAGALNVATNSTISVTFDEPMGGATANAITLKIGATPVPCTFAPSGNTFTCTPSSPLQGYTVYTVSVAGDAARTPSNASAAQDGAGNNLIAVAGNTWTFTTVPVTTLNTGGAEVTFAGGSLPGSLASLSVIPSGALGGTAPVNTAMDAGLSYTINGVTGASVTVELTFPVSIKDKKLYKIKAGQPYQEIPEADFMRLTDFSIRMLILNDGTYDTETVIPNTITDPIAPGALIDVTGITGGGGGGGGCAVDPSGKDTSLLVALLASLGYVGWRRRRS